MIGDGSYLAVFCFFIKLTVLLIEESFVELLEILVIVFYWSQIFARTALTLLVTRSEKGPYRLRYLKFMHNIIYSFGYLAISEERVDKQCDKNSLDLQSLTRGYLIVLINDHTFRKSGNWMAFELSWVQTI